MSNNYVSDEHYSTAQSSSMSMEFKAMAYASERHDWFHGASNAVVASQASAHNRSGFLRRVANAISSWAARGDDDDVAALLERSGGRLTDSVEREMLQRRTHSNWTAFY